MAGKRHVEAGTHASPAVKKVTLARVACLDEAEIDWAAKGWAQAGAKPSQASAAGPGVSMKGESRAGPGR